MEQLNKKIPEALLTLENTHQSMKLANRKDTPKWFPIQYQNEYNKTDLVYDPFCFQLFAQLEAAKREKFPVETMRQWFIEFVRRGWTKKMLQARYDALISTKIYGVEKLDFADWVNSVPVFAEDEVRLMVKQRVEAIIQKGNFLKDKKVELSEEDKKAVDLALAQEVMFQKKNEKLSMTDDYRQERRKLFSTKLHEGGEQ